MPDPKRRCNSPHSLPLARPAIAAEECTQAIDYVGTYHDAYRCPTSSNALNNNKNQSTNDPLYRYCGGVATIIGDYRFFLASALDLRFTSCP
jgi:hypothetical protein